MNTKWLLTLSSVLMGIAGIAALFLPDELLDLVEVEGTHPLPVFVQLMGAMYFAFALQNWMARFSVMGGIYGKPLSIGNFAHFAIGALALIKGLSTTPDVALLWVLCLVYLSLAALFGHVSFTSPAQRPEKAVSI